MHKLFLAVLFFCCLPLSMAKAEVDFSKPLDLKFTAVDGRKVDLAKLRGKVVLIDFWATWCPPCRIISPDIVALYKKYHRQGLEIIGISADSDKGALRDFVKKEGAPWPQYFGENGDTTLIDQLGVEQFPTLWLVNKKGIVVSTELFRRVWTQDGILPRKQDGSTSDDVIEKLHAAIEKQLKAP